MPHMMCPVCHCWPCKCSGCGSSGGSCTPPACGEPCAPIDGQQEFLLPIGVVVIPLGATDTGRRFEGRIVVSSLSQPAGSTPVPCGFGTCSTECCVNVQQAGVPIMEGACAINFEGAGVSVTPGPGCAVTVTVPGAAPPANTIDVADAPAPAPLTLAGITRISFNGLGGTDTVVITPGAPGEAIFTINSPTTPPSMEISQPFTVLSGAPTERIFFTDSPTPEPAPPNAEFFVNPLSLYTLFTPGARFLTNTLATVTFIQIFLNGVGFAPVPVPPAFTGDVPFGPGFTPFAVAPGDLVHFTTNAPIGPPGAADIIFSGRLT